MHHLLIIRFAEGCCGSRQTQLQNARNASLLSTKAIKEYFHSWERATFSPGDKYEYVSELMSKNKNAHNLYHINDTILFVGKKDFVYR